jgi:ABC-type amino acid transport substrate-binding protein
MGGCLVVLGLLLAGPAQCADGNVVKICCHDYPPFYDENAVGFMTLLYKDVFAKAGYTVDIQCYPMKRGVAQFFAGEVDAHTPGMVFMAQAADRFDFVPVVNLPIVYVYYKPHGTRDLYKGDVNDIKGYSVAGLNTSSFIPKYAQAGIPFTPVETVGQILQMVHSGRVNYGELVTVTALVTIQNLFHKDRSNFSFAEHTTSFPIGLAFLKANPRAQEIKAKFIEALELAKQDGTYIRALERIYGKGNVPQEFVLPDMKDKATPVFDAELFYSQKRDNSGLIVGM